MADSEKPVNDADPAPMEALQSDNVLSNKELDAVEDTESNEIKPEVDEKDSNDTSISKDDETKQSATSENEENSVEDKAKKDGEKEEVFDFSSEHPFEENDEAVDESMEADLADEEKVQTDEKDGVDMNKDVEDDEEEEEDEDGDDPHPSSSDPNVMPQVNVMVLAQRKWQVKVYPLKPADFMSGHISRVFKNARESLLYLLSPGRNARGKGEMYISNANQAVRAVFSLMRLTYFYPEINVEIIKKSDEGSIEEKAYIRFDSKMTNLLTMGSFRTGPGRKRERLIGSVFVKNLPAGTTKDVLRVMFPFAQEINYNPEKFKDCTARLVLKSRNHVIPCLKAFAKIELGGNVLELHPLEKKKRPRTEEDEPEAKHRKKTDEVKKEENKDNKKDDETSKSDSKSPESKKDSAKSEKPEKKDTKPASQKTPVRRSAGAASRFNSIKKDRYDQTKSYRPKLVGGQERSPRGPGAGPRRGNGRSDWTSDRLDRNKGRQDKVPGLNRNFRDDRTKGIRNQGVSGRSFGRSPRGFGGARSNTSGATERMSYAMSNQNLGASVSPSNASLAINADATKEMVILQSQLSMAIKNQLAMLNQTQLAVEQAKRGASSLGIGSELQQSRQSAKAFGGASGGGGGYGKRSAESYRRGDEGMEKQYGGRNNRQRERGVRAPRGAQGGGGGGGYGKRGGAFREQMEESYYDDRSAEMDIGMSQGMDGYGRSSRDFAYENRSSGAGGFGSPGRSGYGQDSSSYSGYY